MPVVERRFLSGGLLRVCAAFATCCFSGFVSTDNAQPGSYFTVPDIAQKAEAATKGQTLGFVATWFVPATYDDKAPGNCPEGYTNGPDVDGILASKKFSAADITRLKQPASRAELAQLVYARGPHGENVCAAPWNFPDPGMRTGQSKVNVGLNLRDGKNPPAACHHPDAVAPWGEKGIDNQLGRVIACTKGWNESGFFAEENRLDMQSGDYTVLLEISGVHNLKNDDDVTVGLYSGSSVVLPDAKGAVRPYVTHPVYRDPLYSNVWKARIVDGILTTKESHDVHVRLSTIHAHPNNAMFLSDGRLRLDLRKPGEVDGYLGGYLDLAQIMRFFVLDNAENGRWTCDGMYWAFLKAADGYPDPKSGQCMRISAAWHIKAIPGFLSHNGDTADNHWPDNTSVAQARPFTRPPVSPAPAVAADGRIGGARRGTATVDDISDRWSEPSVNDGPAALHTCQFLQRGNAITAACGSGDPAAAPDAAPVAPAPVVVSKTSDRLTWEYHAGKDLVQVSGKLVSGMTIEGVATVGKLSQPFRLRRHGFGAGRDEKSREALLQF